LELNWAIGGNDLNHRLVKLRDFLLDGKKVEVLLAPKRKGRAATPEECENVVKRIKSVVAECKGASVAKAPEGKIGAMMTMVFEGKKLKKETKPAEPADAPAAG
jgi:translation initiation factor IF-3